MGILKVLSFTKSIGFRTAIVVIPRILPYRHSSLRRPTPAAYNSCLLPPVDRRINALSLQLYSLIQDQVFVAFHEWVALDDLLHCYSGIHLVVV